MIGKQCSQQAACPVESIQVLALFISVNATNAVNLSNHFSFSVHPQPSVWSPFIQKYQWNHPAPEGSGKRWPSWQHQADHKDPAHSPHAHGYISAHYSPCWSHHGPEEHCKEGAQTGTSGFKLLFKISAASSPINFITNLAFFFSFELDPGTGSSAVHGQEPWPWASYAFLHRPVWNQTFSWFGDSTCQHCEDRGESAVSELYLLSHEVPEQEHLHRPLISVRILFSLQSTSTNRPGDVPTCGSFLLWFAVLQLATLLSECWAQSWTDWAFVSAEPSIWMSITVKPSSHLVLCHHFSFATFLLWSNSLRSLHARRCCQCFLHQQCCQHFAQKFHGEGQCIYFWSCCWCSGGEKKWRAISMAQFHKRCF